MPRSSRDVQGFKDVQTAAGAPPSSGTPTSYQANIEQQLAANNPAFEMSGLTAPDGPSGLTVQIKLTTSCGWCLTRLDPPGRPRHNR